MGMWGDVVSYTKFRKSFDKRDKCTNHKYADKKKLSQVNPCQALPLLLCGRMIDQSRRLGASADLRRASPSDLSAVVEIVIARTDQGRVFHCL